MKTPGIANLLAAILILTLAAHARTSPGTVTGTVLDQSGATVAGACVSLIGVDTGVKLSTESNDAGFIISTPWASVFTSFRSPSLDFGRSGINMGANRVTAFDPRLEVGAAETRIEVNGESSEMLVRDSPLRGGNFQPREVRDLPWVESVLPGSDTTRRNGGRGQLGHERSGKHGRPILD